MTVSGHAQMVSRMVNLLEGFKLDGVAKSELGFEFLRPYAEGLSTSIHELKGQYRLAASAIDAEIEFMDIGTSSRFAMVAKSSRNAAVTIPEGKYQIWWRSLSPPGHYPKAMLRLLKMTIWESLFFYSRKAIDIAKQPKRLPDILRRVARNRPLEAVGVALSPRGEPLPREDGAVAFDSNIIAWVPLSPTGRMEHPVARGGSKWIGLLPPAVSLYSEAPKFLCRALQSANLAIVADIDVETTNGRRPSFQAEIDTYRLTVRPLDDVLYIVRREYLAEISEAIYPEEAILDLLRRKGGSSISRFNVSIGVRGMQYEYNDQGSYRERMKQFVPNQGPTVSRISVVIPSRDRPDLLVDCLHSLSCVEDVDMDIIIVDNGSILPETIVYLEEISRQERICIVRDEGPFNYSRLANFGASHSTGDAILFLNDDVIALDNVWLKEMKRYLTLADVGVVGARLIYPSGDLQHAGIATNLLPGPGHPWRGAPPHEWSGNPILSQTGTVDAVTGACLLIRRGLFEEVGGFNTVNFGVTLNDVDLCLKARARGLKTLCVTEATLCHKEGQSRQTDDAPQQQARRGRELAAFVAGYPGQARHSVFYPPTRRRDTDTGERL